MRHTEGMTTLQYLVLQVFTTSPRCNETSYHQCAGLSRRRMENMVLLDCRLPQMSLLCCMYAASACMTKMCTKAVSPPQTCKLLQVERQQNLKASKATAEIALACIKWQDAIGGAYAEKCSWLGAPCALEPLAYSHLLRDLQVGMLGSLKS